MKKMDDESKEFGKRLRALRVERSLKAEDVAKGISVASSTYREWENGRAITGMPYKNLARVFGISLSELFLGDAMKLSEIRDSLNNIEHSVRMIRSSL